MAEGARLESVYTLTGIVGSNPTLSAIPLYFSNLQLGEGANRSEHGPVQSQCSAQEVKRQESASTGFELRAPSSKVERRCSMIRASLRLSRYR